MRSLILVVVALAVASVLGKEEGKQGKEGKEGREGTRVTFFVEHEVDPQKDYLQIIVNIKAEDTSLKEALSAAEETVAFVRQQVE